MDELTTSELHKHLLDIHTCDGEERLGDGQALIVFAVDAPDDRCTVAIAGQGGELLAGLGTIIGAVADQMEVPPTDLCGMLSTMLEDSGGPYKVSTEELYDRH